MCLAAVQTVLADLQVRRLNRLVLPIATDKTVRPAPQASDASVALGAVRPGVDFPDPCLEVVRGFRPSASADAQEPQVARPRRPPDALPQVAYARLLRFLFQYLLLVWDVAPGLPLDVALELQLLRGRQKMALQVARWAPQDESELVLGCLLLARSARASSLREQQAQASQRAESRPPERSPQEQQRAEPA
jgi:hypothetical protein